MDGGSQGPIEKLLRKAINTLQYELLVSFGNDFMYWVVDKNHPIQSVHNRLGSVSERLDVFLKETQRPKVTAAKVKSVWDNNISPILEKMARSKMTRPVF